MLERLQRSRFHNYFPVIFNRGLGERKEGLLIQEKESEDIGVNVVLDLNLAQI